MSSNKHLRLRSDQAQARKKWYNLDVMAKTVYIETTIPSAYVSHRDDAASIYRRTVTREWWSKQAELYDLCTSEATLTELRGGRYPGQDEAVELAASLPLVEITDEAYEVAELYIRHHLMPEGASGDALHLALASMNEVDYLLTWNIRHLGNPNKVEHMAVINRRLGLLSPVIVTPDELWEDVP